MNCCDALALDAVALRSKSRRRPMAQDQTQQPPESMLSTAMWTGAALIVVVLVAIYAAM
jgi:hypothetical protein